MNDNDFNKRVDAAVRELGNTDPIVSKDVNFAITISIIKRVLMAMKTPVETSGYSTETPVMTPTNTLSLCSICFQPLVIGECLLRGDSWSCKKHWDKEKVTEFPKAIKQEGIDPYYGLIGSGNMKGGFKWAVDREPKVWLERAKDNISIGNYDRATKCINEAIELIYGKAE